MDSDLPKKFNPQRLSYFNDALAVHLLDFPIYYLECISERHFVVAGGGGSSKTGVHNQINILELVPTGDSCAADLIMKYHTPEEIPDAIMTGSLMRDLPIINTRLVTGGSHVAIYHLSFDSPRKTFSIVDYEILRDKQVQSELKSVKCLPGRILTGGLDGQLTLWSVKDTTSKKVMKHIKAHSKEIDEIDVDLSINHVVTLSRDEGRCVVWSLDDLKPLHEFKRDFFNNNETPNAKYSLRSCRYAFDSNQDNTKISSKSYLLIACNPLPKTGPSKLYRLSTSNYKDFIQTPATMDGIMAMTVSLDGKHVAIGMRSGSVSIHEVNSMKRIYHLDGAHYNAVTNLEFLAPKSESLNLTNSKICALMSVSIDRRIVLHRPRKGSAMFSFLKVVVMVFILYMVFFLMYKSYTS